MFYLLTKYYVYTDLSRFVNRTMYKLMPRKTTVLPRNYIKSVGAIVVILLLWSVYMYRGQQQKDQG